MVTNINRGVQKERGDGARCAKNCGGGNIFIFYFFGQKLKVDVHRQTDTVTAGSRGKTLPLSPWSLLCVPGSCAERTRSGPTTVSWCLSPGGWPPLPALPKPQTHKSRCEKAQVSTASTHLVHSSLKAESSLLLSKSRQGESQIQTRLWWKAEHLVRKHN